MSKEEINKKEVTKKQTNKQKHIVFRLNVLFFIVFLLFSALIYKLGKLQLIEGGETYKNRVAAQENPTTKISVPRGQIFDRSGEKVVSNEAIRVLNYTRAKHAKIEDISKIAGDLAHIVEISAEDIEKLTETDKKDFWMQKNVEKAQKKVTEQDIQNFRTKKLEGKILDKKIEELRRQRITLEELHELTPFDLKVLVIQSKMTAGTSMTPQVIKKNISEKEFAVISENIEKFPGVDATIDWERNYVNGELFRSVLGNITNVDEGLPKDRLDYYLTRDYDRNERVGKSYIEQRYEEVLHGTKKEIKNSVDSKGNIIQTETVHDGKSGANLTLTIDMQLQKKVEEILEKYLKNAQRTEPLLDRAFVVMMNPKTGELLSMAGKKLIKNEGNMDIQDFALGTMTGSYELGSTVKGATILTGYETGAIKPGTYFYDAPMKFKGTKEKKSWKEFGNIDDVRALQVSSNVYMFHTALKIAGVDYVPNRPLDIKAATFDQMRYYFGEFGLGVPTGIELPNETSGQIQKQNYQPGFLLDLAIGQYDAYPPLQLAQYISTIANDGYRMKPQYVKEIRKSTSKKDEVGKVIASIEPVVLNRVDMKREYIERVQEGFRRVFQEGDGTGVKYFQNAPYKPAGKTGTAQTIYGGDDPMGKDAQGNRIPCYNLTLAGYAPYNNPEIAFSVVVPWVHDDKGGINSMIGREILDAYFALKK